MPTKPAVTIRFRKGSATHVIYVSGKVLESGFDSLADALSYLEDKYPELAERAKEGKCLGAGF